MVTLAWEVWVLFINMPKSDIFSLETDLQLQICTEQTDSNLLNWDADARTILYISSSPCFDGWNGRSTEIPFGEHSV